MLETKIRDEIAGCFVDNDAVVRLLDSEELRPVTTLECWDVVIQPAPVPCKRDVIARQDVGCRALENGER